MPELKHIKDMQVNGVKIEMKAICYKNMSVPVYYGYTSTGHCVGYSKDLNKIVKRVLKKQGN